MKVMFALLTAFAASAVAAPTLEFKGVPIGATREQLLAAIHENALTACRGEPGNEICVLGVHTYASAPVHGAAVRFVDGGVALIALQFRPQDYETIAQAITDKYGKPSLARETKLNNALGATFIGHESSWHSDAGIISASRYGPTTKAGTLTIGSRAAIQAAEADRATKRRSAKKDI